jgi:hypothetical protein
MTINDCIPYDPQKLTPGFSSKIFLQLSSILLELSVSFCSILFTMASHPNGPPPLFVGASGVSSGAQQAVKGHAPALNLDDIFGDVMFTPDGETVFLSEQADELLNSGEGDKVATMASRPVEDGHFVPVPQGGGLYTTNLADPSKASLSMGSASAGVKPTEPVPFKHNPQPSHQIQFAITKKKKDRSEQQKVDRRYVE